jgi:ABC-2 type transport system ATP-binding protein
MSLLNISNLSKKFGDFIAVDDFNLTLEPGQIYALLGPNGAGKTTTIKMVMGLLKPTTGNIKIADIDISEDRINALRHVGFLPDEPFFHDYLKGYEILQFVGEMHNVPTVKIQENIIQFVKLFELEEAIEDYAVNYSLGMKKRLGLIAAIMHSPQLLILDEPVNGLDPYGVKILHQFLLDYTQKGNTVIYSTHVLAQAEKLCNTVGIVYKGKLVRSSSLIDLKNEYIHLPTLEEIFFEMTGHHVE